MPIRIPCHFHPEPGNVQVGEHRVVVGTVVIDG